MTARTVTQLQGVGLFALAAAAVIAIAIALAALAVPARASSPALAHAEPAAVPLVVIQDADAGETARRFGWPVGVLAVVTISALALGAAGRRRGQVGLGRLAQGTAATTAGAGAAIGSAVLDALIAGGSPGAVGVAIVATILAFWRARRPAPGSEDGVVRAGERGSAPVALLAWIGAPLAVVGLAMGAWSCSGAQRRAVAAVVDCTAGVLAEQADAWRPLVGAAIRSGDWAAVRAAAMTTARDAVGCAAAAVVIEIERPPGVVAQSLAGSGAGPAAARAAWERLRADQLGGRAFVTRAGGI